MGINFWGFGTFFQNGATKNTSDCATRKNALLKTSNSKNEEKKQFAIESKVAF
jgi:hypothetical protein